MGAAGIIVEYNPLHSGHLRLLEAGRAALGPDVYKRQDLFKEFLILPILSENLPHVKSGGVLLKLPVYKNQKAEESVAPWGRLCYTLSLIHILTPTRFFCW